MSSSTIFFLIATILSSRSRKSSYETFRSRFLLSNAVPDLPLTIISSSQATSGSGGVASGEGLQC